MAEIKKGESMMSFTRKEHIIRWFNVSGLFCDEVILGMRCKFLLLKNLRDNSANGMINRRWNPLKTYMS